tara:strand:+ start:2204 stop:2677 length:474 start_codon:yes stop_codon:yes gene_type:complete
MAKNLKLTALAAVIVHCTQPTGYRRGGISLASGKQTLSAESLTQEQLEAIENDPRLSVQVIPRDEGTASQGQLDANNVDTTVKLYEHVDYTQAPQALQPIIAIMIDEQMELKPVVEQVTYETPGEKEGEVLKVKVSAADRDAAWLWLQDVDSKGEGE